MPFKPRPDPRPDDTAWPEMVWPVRAGTRLDGATVSLTPADPAADATELFHALDTDAVWAHLPWRPQGVADFARRLRELSALPDWHVWIVRSRTEIGDRPAGAVLGLTSFLDARPRDATLEIGFTAYAPSVWGSAVNPEAKLLLLEHAFDVLGAGRVQLKTDVRNHRSQQAIARLGAVYEGTLRRQFRRSDGTVRDSVLFAVTAEDWPDVRARLAHRVRGPR
ncbi:RimJ/RimL family protein N-acetyltransferase [Nocardia caishijiensis]|uniref:RimJ/RimL family protein N-acetyltransferase n=1 Tax=Nocardia caishijiensis TaxID=184756 RepID=A0ABQ6YHA9_9NOCA|nr:RimJ/RimL family protein N-acetyltransferase [Nocardia caishijiensis]